MMKKHKKPQNVGIPLLLAHGNSPTTQNSGGLLGLLQSKLQVLTGVAQMFLHLLVAFPRFLTSWWFQPIWKICSSNWIISLRLGVKIKNIGNHHLVKESPEIRFIIHPVSWIPRMDPGPPKSTSFFTKSPLTGLTPCQERFWILHFLSVNPQSLKHGNPQTNKIGIQRMYHYHVYAYIYI